MKQDSQSVSRKGSKLLGFGERQDILLETIFIHYTGELIKGDTEEDALRVNQFRVINRLDVTDFIDPTTGEINIPPKHLLENVPGFKAYIEEKFQERVVIRLSLGLKTDKYKVEWRKKKGKRKEGFKRTDMSKAINPNDV